MILHRYFARRYIMAFLGTLGIFFAMLTMIDLPSSTRSCR